MKPYQLLRCSIYTCTLLAIACTGTGVQAPYYAPVDRQRENKLHHLAPVVTTQLSQAGQANVSLYTGKQLVGLQTGYMFHKHLAANLAYTSFSSDVSGGYQSSFGLGYVRAGKTFQSELFGGYSVGKTNNWHYSGHSFVKNRAMFLQPAIAFNDEEQLMQFGLHTRFSFYRFQIDTAFSNDREQLAAKEAAVLYRYPRQLFIEPGLHAQIGWKHIQLRAAYNFSINASGHEFERNKSRFSAGLIVRVKP